MNREKYNIQQLFGLAFGQNPFVITRGVAERIASGNLLNRYRVDMGEDEGAELSYQGIEVVEEPEDVETGRMSYMGTPIIYPLTFGGGTFNRYSPKGELEEVTIGEFEMPAVTLCDVRRAKNLSVTRRLAGYGTVKEMYGFDDWRIDIRGLCLPDPTHPQNLKTAFQQHLQMMRYEEAASNIPVFSKILNDKGIDAIVIEEIVFGQLPGKPKVIPFQIRAFSDPCDELED